MFAAVVIGVCLAALAVAAGAVVYAMKRRESAPYQADPTRPDSTQDTVAWLPLVSSWSDSAQAGGTSDPGSGGQVAATSDTGGGISSAGSGAGPDSGTS